MHNDRRIIVSAWNAADVPKMALPPGHAMFQHYVSEARELSCQMYQRSGDLGLGVPFIIASYSLLTCHVAHVCGLKRGEFIHILGDAHVYNNHITPLQIQMQQEPKIFPTLEIKNKIENQCKIEDFAIEDLDLINYQSHPAIKMEMAV